LSSPNDKKGSFITNHNEKVSALTVPLAFIAKSGERGHSGHILVP
jgi:hypothetical protein